ncbi:MAG: CPBP family intramembrane metalloprotease [Clostridia bacterium]|nr:CPBP family intramembrane metalloprotease [Clostridia bacterium]
MYDYPNGQPDNGFDPQTGSPQTRPQQNGPGPIPGQPPYQGGYGPNGGRPPVNAPRYVAVQEPGGTVWVPVDANSGGRLRLSPERQSACTREIFLAGLLFGGAFLLYLLLRYVFILPLNLNDAFYNLYMNDVNVMYLFDTLFTLVCVGVPFLIAYLLLGAKRLPPRREIPLGAPRSGLEAALLAVGGVGVCLAVSVAVNYVMLFAEAFGFSFSSAEMMTESFPLPEGAFGIFLFLLRTAVMPAFVEELAFRGVILQTLRRYGDWFAIVVTAILFGLTHGNMTQTPFALAAGVMMGYAAVVTGSLRASIAMHLLNNGVSCLSQLIVGNADSVTAAALSAILVYGLMLAGLVCIVVYCVRNKAAFRLRPGDYPFARRKARWFFLAPTMLIAVIIFLIEIVSDVSYAAPDISSYLYG